MKLKRALLSFLVVLMFFSSGAVAQNFAPDMGVSSVIVAQAARLKLEKTKITLTTGESFTQKLYGADGRAIKGTKVTWKTPNKKLVKIDKNGKVTAVAKGSVTLTAKYQGKTYSFTVKVKDATLSVKSNTIYVGGSFTQTLKNAMGKNISASAITWKSSDKKIVTVSAKGVVKGVKKGKATVTATYKGKKYSFKVTVKNASLKLSSSSAIMYPGEYLSLDPKTTPERARVKYTVSNKKILEVSEFGSVKALKSGTATVTATLYISGQKIKTAKCKITVKEPSVSFKTSNVTCYYGEYKYVNVVKYPTYASVTYTSSNTASVSEIAYDGRINIPSRYSTGTSKITAKITVNKKTYTATCNVTVLTPTVTLDKSTLLLEKNKTSAIKATVSAPSGTSVSWKSSNTSVATVSSSGVIKALDVGKTIITATITVGSYTYEAKCEVSVHNGGYNFSNPLSGQSGREISMQKYSSGDIKKIKINVKKVIKGARANSIAETLRCSTTSAGNGYEWRFIIFDLDYISSTAGDNTELNCLMYFNPSSTGKYYTAQGSPLEVKNTAILSRGVSAGGVNGSYDWTKVKLLPGMKSEVVVGMLIPEDTGDILYRVEKYPLSTWVRLSVPESSADTPEAMIDQVKECISSVGGRNSSGYRFIKTEYTSGKNSDMYGIMFDTDKDSLLFTFVGTTNQIQQSIQFELKAPTTSLETSVIVKFTPSSGTARYGDATAQINMELFNSGTCLDFDWNENSDPEIAESSDEMLNTALQCAFYEWNKLLKSKAGIELSEIGFEAYGS